MTLLLLLRRPRPAPLPKLQVRQLLFSGWVDCIPGKWESETPSLPEDKTPRKFTIGVLRKDGLLEPLPPIARVLDEVASKLRKAPGIEVVEIPVPKSLSKCQSLANALLGADGGNRTMDLMESMSEPFVPWLKRLKRGQAKSVEQLSQIQARREEAKQDCYKMWRTASGDKVDAIIHPVAPHPVPGIDRFNATSYCINWVLMDYPAASLPVRNMTEADLELGKEMDAPRTNPEM
ncbi:hypothetical protein KEM55_005669 [Ascosphaera atra]|nr:hypothetical protein KEM55_005669 [Ascosphaera atra]